MRPGSDLIRAFCYALLIEATAVLIVVCALGTCSLYMLGIVSIIAAQASMACSPLRLWIRSAVFRMVESYQEWWMVTAASM